MRIVSGLIFLVLSNLLQAQELYPYTEPASNMPARSLGLKLNSMIGTEDMPGKRWIHRYTPEVMAGLSPKWMIHLAGSFSNMQQEGLYFESVRLYTKYRFHSYDEVQKHFRMAGFLTASYSRNALKNGEINLFGDHSGVQAGIIGTVLKKRTAASATLAINQVLDTLRWSKALPQQFPYQSLSYSLSIGHLLLPRVYKDYNQTNLNLYLEVLGAYNLDWPYERNFIDLAPSVQFIFKSTSKLNIGYRFQVQGDVNRAMKSSLMIGYEYLFLEALGK